MCVHIVAQDKLVVSTRLYCTYASPLAFHTSIHFVTQLSLVLYRKCMPGLLALWKEIFLWETENLSFFVFDLRSGIGHLPSLTHLRI